MLASGPRSVQPAAAMVTLCILGVAMDASAALRYRNDGASCQPFSDADRVVYWNTFGAQLDDPDGTSGNGTTNNLVCAIPTGISLVELDNTNGLQLDIVRVRGKYVGASNETVVYTLLAHDYDSDMYCECDIDEVTYTTTPQHFTQTLDFAGDASTAGCDACPGSVDPAWLLTLDVLLSDDVGGTENLLTIKYIGVFDT